MDRLGYVIVFTGDVAGLSRFYESTVGLAARLDSPGWVEFDTGGATLALCAMPDPAQRGVHLRFVTDQIESRVGELAGRGAAIDPGGIVSFPRGKLASITDSEGNVLSLWQPATPQIPPTGLDLSVTVNCRDLPRARDYYRDALGFLVTVDSPWWVQLAVGEAGMGLHPRGEGGRETHHAQAITIGFGIPGLREWVEDARGRGLEFTAPPTDRGYGTFADAVDPDGNPLTFRDVPEPETIEERLAEAFEDEAAPRRAAIRKPVRKRATGSSRLALKPVHRAKPATLRRARKRAAPVVSPRGTGPAGARRKPKRMRDTKRARAKPAIGRLRKAERRTLARKKQAVASASKARPVKRASRSRPLKSRSTPGRARR